MTNIINWFEIPVLDMDRAITFYEPAMQVVLNRETMNGTELAVFPYRASVPGGALAKSDGILLSLQGIIVYLHTADLAATLKRIIQAGGSCIFGPLDLPNSIGSIALFTDSEGNRVGLHQPG